MKYSLEKIIELVNNSEERFIVLDKQKDAAYVILPLKEYEQILKGINGVRGLTEEELLDKINRDIALWRSGQEKESVTNWEPEDISNLDNKTNKESRLEVFQERDILTQDNKEDDSPEDHYYFEPIE